MKKLNLIMNIARVALILALVGAAVWYFASGHEFSVEAVLGYTPERPLLAAIFLLILYAVKSVAVFLPLMVLQIAVGLCFPIPIAILVNILGMMIELTIGYKLGRFLGVGAADRLFEKFPKVRSVVEGGTSKWFVSYILRAVNMLPFDLVSMYLGSIRVPFPIYFSGSLVGAMFGILAATLIGMSLTDPTSPLFIGSCIASCLLAGSSLLIYRRITSGSANTKGDSE